MNRVREVSVWLENKLGSNDDQWNSCSICSQWTTEKLACIPACFVDLSSHVKVKVLLSFIHLGRKVIEQSRAEIDEIIGTACEDTDEWVQVIAEILKNYPESGALSLDCEQLPSSSHFVRTLAELKQLVSKLPKDIPLNPPIEAEYASRGLFSNLIGAPGAPERHFLLRRKPKSASLRAELLQKSADAQALLKLKAKGGSQSYIVPIRARNVVKKPDNKAPMKGVPTLSAAKTSGGFGNNRTYSLNRPTIPKKEGGIKMIELDELPTRAPGKRAAKKKLPVSKDEKSESKKAKLDKSAIEESNNNDNNDDDTPSVHDPLELSQELMNQTNEAPTAVNISPCVDNTNNFYSPDRQQGNMSFDHYFDQQQRSGLANNDYHNRNHFRGSEAFSPPSGNPVVQHSPQPTLGQQFPSAFQLAPSINNLGFTPQSQAPNPPMAQHQPINSMLLGNNSGGGNTNYLIPQTIGGQQNDLIAAQGPSLGMMRNQGSNATALPVASNNQFTTLMPGTRIMVRTQTGQQILLPVGIQPASAPPNQYPVPLQQLHQQHPAQQQLFIQPPHLNQQSLLQPQLQVQTSAASPMMMVNQQQQPSSQSLLSQAGLGVQVRMGNPNPMGSMVQTMNPLQPNQGLMASPQPATNAPPPVEQQPKKTYRISRELMDEAQAMFRVANKLTRPEKALIMAFMAGNRENPCPQMGNVINVRLSENKETVIDNLTGQSKLVVVETFFQMDYQKGCHSKLRKVRELKPEEMNIA